MPKIEILWICTFILLGVHRIWAHDPWQKQIRPTTTTVRSNAIHDGCGCSCNKHHDDGAVLGSLATSTYRGGGGGAAKWERMDGKHANPPSSPPSHEPVPSSLQHQIHSIQSRLVSYSGGQKRRACGFYVWDAPSALLYRWCNHLLKDRIYEGQGGYKFVRIEPGSVLQLLYPCSRYSPDRCLLCGGNYRDHLALWWSKNLYTPFDLYLDRTYQAGVVMKAPNVTAPAPAPTRAPRGMTRAQRRRRRELLQRATAAAKSKPVVLEPKHFFHANYVLDLRYSTIDIPSRKQKRKVAKQILLKTNATVPLEFHELPTLKTGYLVPRLPDSVTKNGQKVEPSFMLRYVRSRLFDHVNNLIQLEDKDNKLLQSKSE